MSRQPLSAEERALADKLARTTPRAEPSAALDARILAQAEAAEAPVARRQRRLGPGFGVAAAALLAAGLAWHMGMFQNPGLVLGSGSETPASATLPEAPSEAADAALMREAQPEALKPEALESSAPAAEMPPPPPAPAPAAPVAAPAPPASEPPAPMAAPTRRPPAYPTSPMRLRAPPPSSQDTAPVAATTAPEAGGQAEAGLDLEQEAMLPAEAWLERIREHLQDGETQTARDSLRLFVSRHPEHPLPDDLAGLLHE